MLLELLIGSILTSLALTDDDSTGEDSTRDTSDDEPTPSGGSDGMSTW